MWPIFVFTQRPARATTWECETPPRSPGFTRTCTSTLRRGRRRRASARDSRGGFAVDLGRWHEGPVGPHTSAMYQVTFTLEQFANVVPWMMLNRGGLRVLVHPMTGDDVADHTSNPLWLGEPLPLDL